MIKVVHLTNWFSPSSETFIYDLIVGLEKLGLTENYVITGKRVLKEERPFEKVILVKNKNSFFEKILNRIIILFFIKLTDNYFYRKKNSKLIAKIIKKLQPDVIHSHYGPNGIAMYHLLKDFNLDIPHVVSFHGMDVNTLPIIQYNYKEQLLKLNKANKSVFTTPSIFLKEKLMTLGIDEKKIYVVNNSFNPAFAEVTKTKYFKYGETLNILNIGRLESVKGHIYLIRALPEIIKQYPNVKLNIIGEGSLKTFLISELKKLNIESHVNFLGTIPHNKLPNEIVKNDIYITPSIVNEKFEEESFSISTIEAMVVGLPAIVTNTGGLKALVKNNETGFVVNPNDPLAISNAIKFYIKNPQMIEQHSLNASNFVKENFNQLKMLNEINNLYLRLL